MQLLEKWRGTSNKVNAAIFDSNENIDELESKALDLLVNICPNAQPWPRALGSDQNNHTADTKSGNELPLWGTWGQP